MTLRELLAGFDCHPAPSATDLGRGKITRVITAPEQNCENTLYVCAKTPICDGNRGLEAAYAGGCRAFLCAHDRYPGPQAEVWITADPERLMGPLCDRLYGHPSGHLTVLGVTGTAGKSSVCEMAREILARAGKRVASLTDDGLRHHGMLIPSAPIAPNAASVQRQLADLTADGVEFALLELSAYQLAHHVAEGISFVAHALTNFSPRHIGPLEFCDLGAYRAAKHRLLEKPAAACVLPVGYEASPAATPCFVGKGGALWTEDCVEVVDPALGVGTRFTLCDGVQKIGVFLPVPGDFFVDNALVAAALCRVAGLSLQEIADGMSGLLVPGRMECLHWREGRLILADRAFLPEDLSCVLSVARRLCAGRLSVLLGSVGNRARERRAALGAAACRGADFVYLTADDPDTEDPEMICEQMRAGMGKEVGRCCVLPDRRAAILRAAHEMRPGDVLLLAGKGADRFQLIGGRRLPFCEREIVSEAFS